MREDTSTLLTIFLKHDQSNNLDTIQALFDKTQESNINLEFLKQNGLASKSDLVKVLGRGEFTAKVNVTVHAFSKSAEEAIAKAGGTAVVAGNAAGEEVNGGE